MNLSHKKILVLGAGREGAATWKYLHTTYPTCEVTIADQQTIENTFFGLKLDNNIQKKTSPDKFLFNNDYPESLDKWDITVISPGYKPDTTLLDSAHKITTATNLFFQDCQGTIIGVTGSKGKSTTASLLAHILKKVKPNTYLVGNIGQPALLELSQHNSPNDIFVFELSSYQTSRLVSGPDIAIVLNLFPEHIDYHRSVSKYYLDKLQITMKQNTTQSVFYNIENEQLTKYIKSSTAQLHAFPDNKKIHLADDYLKNGSEQIINIDTLPLRGEHNLMNVIAAVSCAVEFDVTNETIAAALHSFQPLPHRLETVGTWHEITFVDDAISTTPESTIAALNTIDNVSTLILGGQDRAFDYSELTKKIKTLKVDNIVLFPDADDRIMHAFGKANFQPSILQTSSMEEAVKFAYKKTSAGATCLLSCAAPSYSIFQNFEDKGNQFKRWANKLGGSNL